jgi:hypothetical protein
MNTDESQGKNRGFCCPCFSVFSAVEPEKKDGMATDEHGYFGERIGGAGTVDVWLFRKMAF